LGICLDFFSYAIRFLEVWVLFFRNSIDSFNIKRLNGYAWHYSSPNLLRFHPMVIEQNTNSEIHLIEPKMKKQKFRIKNVFLRGDPREFLG